LTPLAQHVSEQQDLWLRRMASAQRTLSEEFSDVGSEDHAERCLELAEQALRDSLAIKSSFEGHISLAEMLIEDEELDEAEDHLLQAKELTTNAEEEAHVELHLGEIAMEQEQFQEALDHYQRVVDLQPNSSHAWFDVGEAHQKLQHFDEAETSYQRAIELEPDRAKYYFGLRRLYSENDQPAKAMKTLKQGLAANPDSADMLLYMVGYHIELHDFHQAEILLDKAEELDADPFSVSAFRFVLDANKAMQSRNTPKLPKQAKPKKKKR
jgi:tetratricopeptide (TPR) repeat protein